MKNYLAPILAAAVFTPEVTVSYIGVPLNVLVACVAGAYSSFSFGDKVEPRSYMFKLFVACVIMGAAFTGLVIGGIEFFVHLKTTHDTFRVSPGVQAGLGAFVSCITRFGLPPIIEIARTGAWMNWLPFVRRKNPPDGE
jgi:hypothetical protein